MTSACGNPVWVSNMFKNYSDMILLSWCVKEKRMKLGKIFVANVHRWRMFSNSVQCHQGTMSNPWTKVIGIIRTLLDSKIHFVIGRKKLQAYLARGVGHGITEISD